MVLNMCAPHKPMHHVKCKWIPNLGFFKNMGPFFKVLVCKICEHRYQISTTLGRKNDSDKIAINFGYIYTPQAIGLKSNNDVDCISILLANVHTVIPVLFSWQKHESNTCTFI